MSLVLDSSVTLAWIYADETTAAIRALLISAAFHVLRSVEATEFSVRLRRRDARRSAAVG
jgi:hypothetical protein